MNVVSFCDNKKCKEMKKLNIILTLIFFSFIGFAQKPMTLKDCMEFASNNSAQILVEKELCYQKKIDRRDAILNVFTPQINAYAGLALTNGRTTDPETNMYTDLKMFQDEYQISASMPIFNGFEAVNNMKISKIALESGKNSLQVKTDEICLEIMQYFYNYLYFLKMTKVFFDEKQEALSALQQTEKEFSLGNKSRVQVLEKQSFLSEAEYSLADYEAKCNAALSALKKAMMFPSNEVLEIDTTINFQPVLTDDFENATELATLAKESNSQVLVFQNSLKIKELEFKTAKWQFLPRIDLNAGWYSSHSKISGVNYQAQPFKDQIKNNGREYISISLNVPIFNRLQKFSNFSRKKSDFKIASYEFQEKQTEIENAVLEAFDEVLSARKKLLAAQKNADFQKEYYEIAAKKFQAGMIPYLEFNTAANKYAEAQAMYFNALFVSKIKTAVIEYYKGVSYLEQIEN